MWLSALVHLAGNTDDMTTDHQPTSLLARSRPGRGTVIDAARADELARLAHGEDRTKAGTRFIDHVRSVAARMGDDPDPYAIVAALLHDSVEKGCFGWGDLWAAGADSRLLEIVDALTERDGEPEMVYLGRCAADPLALRISEPTSPTNSMAYPARPSLVTTSANSDNGRSVDSTCSNRSPHSVGRQVFDLRR